MRGDFADPAVAIGQQRSDLGAHSVDQNGIDRLGEALCRSTVDPVSRTRQHKRNVSARHAQSRTDRLSGRPCPTRASGQSTFFASELDCLLQYLRFHRFLAEHALQLGNLGTGGTTESPAVTAVSTPSRSSLRQLNSWLPQRHTCGPPATRSFRARVSRVIAPLFHWQTSASGTPGMPSPLQYLFVHSHKHSPIPIRKKRIGCVW